MNFWGLLNLDTEWTNHRCAPMRCKLSFYLAPLYSWNDNWHLPLILPSRYELMRQCWKENPTERPSFAVIRKQLERMMLKHCPYLDMADANYSYAPCYDVDLTKERNSKILPCNLRADLSVRFFDMMRSWHFVYTFLSSTSKFIL